MAHDGSVYTPFTCHCWIADPSARGDACGKRQNVNALPRLSVLEAFDRSLENSVTTAITMPKNASEDPRRSAGGLRGAPGPAGEASLFSATCAGPIRAENVSGTCSNSVVGGVALTTGTRAGPDL